MKLIIQHGSKEYEYTEKDLKREAQALVNSVGFHCAGALLIDYTVVITREGRVRLKVKFKRRITGMPHCFSEPTTDYVAL